MGNIMQEYQQPSQPASTSDDSSGDFATEQFSDEAAREIYKRAAQIESKTLFAEDNLSRAQLENAAQRAGLSNQAVAAAIADIERERVQARQLAANKVKTRQKAGVAGGVAALLLLLNGGLTQRGLSARLAAVEESKSNVEVALQRRQDLVPNVLSLARANLGNERELISALSRPNVSGATLERARQLLQSRGVQVGALDELAGSENRIAVARRRLNESATDYNRAASAFPASMWRGVFGFPARTQSFQAEPSAQTAPKF